MRIPRILASFALVAALSGCASTGSVRPKGPATASLSPTSYTETLSLAATGTTTARYTGNSTTIAFKIDSTGTASGTYTLEYSHDGVNFDTYTLTSTPPAAAGSAQVFGIPVPLYEYPWARIRFTRTGGTGSATVGLFLK